MDPPAPGGGARAGDLGEPTRHAGLGGGGGEGDGLVLGEAPPLQCLRCGAAWLTAGLALAAPDEAGQVAPAENRL